MSYALPTRLLIILLLGCFPAFAASPPCCPCAGVRVDNPLAAVSALAAEPTLASEARLYVSWRVRLDGSADPAAAGAVAEAGGKPWLALVFATPAPVTSHLEQLDEELNAAATLVAAAPPEGHFQVVWEPSNPGDAPADSAEYAFLLKRAAAAITGSQTEARVIAGPLAPERSLLESLYDKEITAYIDGIAFQPGPPEQLRAAVAALVELDPGRPVVVDALAFPDDPARTLPELARLAAAGVAVTFFQLDAPSPAALVPLKVLAREFAGDISFNPYLVPEGGDEAWAFVRGEDLGQRIIVSGPAAVDELEILIPDRQLRSPSLINLETGSDDVNFRRQRTDQGLLVRLISPGPVSVLRLEHMTAAELAGFADEVAVTDTRTMPVEEILKRLQAFEDAQQRKLADYSAFNTTHLRFRGATGVGTVEVTFEGDFFFRRGQGFDWAWQNFYVNGVRWRGKQVPEIPLIRPEKAAVLPLEITFNKTYSYRLRGRASVAGRDCWVVDFEPVAKTKALHRGTVWIDRQLYARVKSQAVQQGLEGMVISNEETFHYAPLDAMGAAAPWSSDSYFLPTRVTGQELQKILNSTIQVEKEILLTNIRLNPDDFEARREQVLASETTMVRDTEEGLRYLVKADEDGQREVKEGFDKDHFFLLGGMFYEESLDFPVPLLGIDYFTLDLLGTGAQFNCVFGGVLLDASIAQTDFLGTRFNAGAHAFGFFLPLEEDLYRNNVVVEDEQVKHAFSSVDFYLGRALGNYAKIDFGYQLSYDYFDRTGDTAELFIAPESTFTHSFETRFSLRRKGYSLALSGSYSSRSKWDFWGFPDNQEYSSDHKDFLRWRFGLAKTWWLPHFMKAGIELEHVNGSDLDRFSRYDFGFFGSPRVSGYQTGLIRASEGNGVHVNYGFNLGEVIQVGINGDAVWATDEVTGLDSELLAGASLSGTVMGPWSTLVFFDIGVPLAGPGEGFVAQVYFLRRFGW